MNRYYYIASRLYKKSYKKRTNKEIWGDKSKYLYTIYVFWIISFLCFLYPQIFMAINDKFYAPVTVIGYIWFIIMTIIASVFVNKYRNRLEERVSWQKEIERFDKILNDYNFNTSALKILIIQIDSYIKNKSEESKRKYDVMFGLCSVTVLSFIISIGKSIWDSYDFKGERALHVGILVLGTLLLVAIPTLFMISVFYNIVIKRPKEVEKIKRALEEVVFMRDGAKIVVKKSKIIDVLLEEDLKLT